MATIEPNFESICINPNDDLVLYKKEFVRSRIEKFLYAICSLDTDDLPTPLSRIEELYNYLVTGEDIPTFTPLSRAEKFVMAMLSAYNVELLPTPNSRSEILMKKIATGDNNLDDVDNLQSRYEFLLAYIIKAGGFNGGSGDFYYNLTSLTSGFTTIYDTLDIPVKNAVLRGQTLVNLVKKLTPENLGSDKEWGLQGSSNPTHTWNSNGSITITSTTTGSMVLNYYNLTLFKPNTEYTLFVSVGWNDVGVTPHLSKISTNDIPLNNGLNIVKFTTVSDLTVQNLPLRLGYAGTVAVGCEYTFNNIIVLEGDWTNDGDIPYFEGMQSVKMPVLKTTGKNLFNINDVEEGGTNWSEGTDSTIGQLRIKRDKLIAVKPNTTYIFNKNNWTVISYYDKNEKSLGGYAHSINTVFTTPDNCYYLRFRNYNNYGSVKEAWEYLEDLQLEEGSAVTEYEPHKSNILTCNEEVELRGIGDIKDELNLVTGEYTKTIHEYTFTGDENWKISGATDGYTYFVCNLSNFMPNYNYKTDANIPIYCDKLPVITYNDFDNRVKNVGINLTYFFRLNFSDCDSNNGATVEDLKAYLKANPTTVQYPISKSVTTVDLSTLDQDGKETELSTFDDITHVIVSSEGLIPTGDIDIARPIQFVDYSLDNGWTTLYNTIDYPVKNAVLRGQTLVNIAQQYSKFGTYTGDVNFDGEFFSYTKPTTATSGLTFRSIYGNFEIGKQISIYVNNQSDMSLYLYDSSYKIKGTFEKGVSSVLFTTDSDSIRIGLLDNSIEANIKVSVMMFEGDCTNCEIPYFTGIQSVKMPVLTTTGKNLFNKNNIIVDGYIISNGALAYETGDNRNASDFIEVEPNCIYRISGIKNSAINGARSHQYVGMYDRNKKFISSTTIYCLSDNATFTTTENTKYIRVSVRNDDINRLQIEKGTNTTYEPYKSTAVLCNEEVTLRGIGDIKDELNLVTGELTQYVGAITIDDSHSWRLNTGMNGEQETYIVFQSNYVFSDYKYIASNLNIINDNFPLVGFGGNANKAGEWLTIGSNGLLYVKISLSKLDTHDVNGFKKWLLQNPITIQYELAETIVKTVDLSTLIRNEDVLLILENGEYINTENGDYIKVGIKGGKTKLSTFDDIAHVTVSSEGLVPTGEITVATKNATDVADASVMSLRMDDILNSQRTLEGPANAQSDDIDVAMLGTTDIYEQLL